MDNKKENSKDNGTNNENNKSKSQKKLKINIKMMQRSFRMPPQPENYKQICRIFDTGKRELIDYSGKNQECDIFGFPVKKYYNNISGISDYNVRLSKDLIQEIKFYNKSLYIPITAKFEGSSMFPRPISLPFVNQDIDPKKLIKEIKKEKRITEIRNKEIFSLKKPLEDKKSIPQFICQKISIDDSSSKKHLMNLVDKYINMKKQEHKFELNFEHKSKEIKALKEYKKFLKENLGKNLYNGKNIKESGQVDIKEKFDAIKKLIYQNAHKGNEINEKENKLIQNNFHKKLKALQRVNTTKHIFRLKENLNRNKSCNDLCGNNRLNLNKEIKIISPNINETNNSMIKTNSVFSQFNKNKGNGKDLKETNSFISSFDKKKNDSFLDKKNINQSVNTTKSCFFNNRYNNDIKLKYNINICSPNDQAIIPENKNKNRTAINFFKKKETPKNDENIKNDDKNQDDDNISFISDEKINKNSIINESNNRYKYKTIKDLKEISEKEKDKLKGYETIYLPDKIKKNYGIFDKKEQAFENYKKDLKLFEIVNKIHYEKERKKNLYKEKILRQKIEGKKIFEKNFRKIHYS